MSVHVVARPNPYFKVGTWVRCFDHGCQQVEVESVDNRMVPGREYGLAFPKETVMKYLIQPGKGKNTRRYLWEWQHK